METSALSVASWGIKLKNDLGVFRACKMHKLHNTLSVEGFVMEMTTEDSRGGLVAALALFVTNFVFKKLLYRSKKISELLQGKAIMLIYEGVLLEQNLHSAEITREELEAAVREHGVQEFSKVKLAIMEVDGNISIVSSDFGNKTSHQSHKTKHKFKGRLNNY